MEYVARGKKDLFEGIKGKLTHRNGAGSYHEIAADLSMSEGAVKVAVHRLRKRYRELLVHEVGQTVTAAGEIDDEVRDLFKAVSH